MIDEIIREHDDTGPALASRYRVDSLFQNGRAVDNLDLVRHRVVGADRTVRLRQLFPSIDTKDFSPACFPGDHAFVLLTVTSFFWYVGRRRDALVASLLAAVFLLPRLVGGAHWASDVVVGSGTAALLAGSWAFATPWCHRFATLIHPLVCAMMSLVPHRLRIPEATQMPAEDEGLELLLRPAEADAALSRKATAEVIDLVAIFPHGAQSYSLAQPADLVDISINLAVLRLSAGELFLEASYRFFNELESVPLQQSVAALARAFSLSLEPVVGYPGWQPDFDSALLAQGVALHEKLFGQRPAIKAIHAGLECGILKSKRPNTDILSFGPTIRGAHSPSERLQIDTVPPFWLMLTELLAQM